MKLSESMKHRCSNSDCLYDRQRLSKSIVREHDSCACAISEGDHVCFFSRSADKCIMGEADKFVGDNVVRVKGQLFTSKARSESMLVHPSKKDYLDGRQRLSKSIISEYDSRTIVEGDQVCFFSRSANKWIMGEVDKLVGDNAVCVQGQLLVETARHHLRKTLPLASEHLDLLNAISSSEKGAASQCTTSSSSSREKDTPSIQSCFECQIKELVWEERFDPMYRRSCRTEEFGDSCTSFAKCASDAGCTSRRSTLQLPEDQDLPLQSAQVSSRPLMQGGHHAGAHYDYRGINPSPSDKYLRLNFLWSIIESGDVLLIKGKWLWDLCRRGGVLPCRQELPDEAYWDPAELAEKVYSGTKWVESHSVLCDEVLFASVSHCWYTQDHPDPNGDQLQEIRSWLKPFVRGPHKDLAVFWCWCSFYQNYYSNGKYVTRTTKEQEAFDRSFPFMDLFYANCNFMVFMLTKVPHDVENNYAYDERGWTTWESIVAKMLTVRHDTFDFPMGPFAVRHETEWHPFRDPEKMRVTPGSIPLDPDRFEAVIRTKHFTKGKTDLEAVLDNYSRNFWDIMSITTVLDLYDVNMAGEGDYLAGILQHCPRLEHVELRKCSGLVNSDLQFFLTAVRQHQEIERLIIYGDFHDAGRSVTLFGDILDECSHLQVVEVVCTNCSGWLYPATISLNNHQCKDPSHRIIPDRCQDSFRLRLKRN